MLKDGRIEGAEFHEGFKRWLFKEDATIKPVDRDNDILDGLAGYLASENLSDDQKAAIVAVWMRYCKGNSGTVFKLRRYLVKEHNERISGMWTVARVELKGVRISLKDFMEMGKVFR